MKQKKILTFKPFVSTCCKGGFKDVCELDFIGDKKPSEGSTCHHECLLCGQSCDIEKFKKPKNNKQNKDWEKEFDLEFNDCEDLREKLGDKLLCTLESHHGSIKQFIAKTLKAEQEKWLKGKLFTYDVLEINEQINIPKVIIDKIRKAQNQSIIKIVEGKISKWHATGRKDVGYYQALKDIIKELKKDG